MRLRLIEKLHSHAAQRPGEIAIRQVVPDNGIAFSWKQLDDRVDEVARELAARFTPGAVVMLCSSNRPEFTAAFLGALAAGMKVFPIAPDIAGPELASAGERSGAAALIRIGHPALPVAGAFSQCSDFPVCAADAMLHDGPTWDAKNGSGAGLLLLSSGTTGRPKIVLRDGPSLDAVSQNMVEAIGFTSSDCVLAAVPLCHSYGMEHGLLCPTWAGSCAHLYDRFDLPAAMAELSRDTVSIFPGVPFMFEMVTGDAGQAPDHRLKLRRAYSAGGALPRGLFDAFAAKFGMPVSQLYGATEIGSVSFNDPSLAPFDPASVGRPMAGVSIRIVDTQSPDIARPLPAGAEGHVAIRAPSMLRQYIDGDPPPLLEGHFLTGDLGRLDPSGALTVTGRIKLLIDIAGRKVNPLEVEQVIASHPTVGDCIVVPLRVSQTLFRLKAFVTPARGGQSPDPRELRQFTRARLSAYKVPRVFEVRESLPKSAAGKIQRHLLEAEVAEGI